MSVEDLAFAVQITNEADWGLSEDDFAFMMESEPDGCFTILDNSEKVGIATNVSFGKIAWFGNLIISEKYRKKGVGSLLVKHSIEYLRNKKVKSIGLYAYIDKIPFYKKLGFEYDSEFIVLKGKGFSSTAKTGLKRAGRHDLPKIIGYDRVCFGASRKNVLEPILQYPKNFCYLSIEGRQLIGYAVAKVYDGMAELGPLVCQRERIDSAIDLLNTTLDKLRGLEVHMCVPKREGAILDMLREHEFTENFRVARMFLGIPNAKDCIYIAESLERG